MTPAPTSELLDALHRLDLVPRGAEVVVTPLAGGVSSDIARVDVAGRSFCVKQALAEAQGRRRLARAGRAQPQRGGMDPRRAARSSRTRCRG